MKQINEAVQALEIDMQLHSDTIIPTIKNLWPIPLAVTI